MPIHNGWYLLQQLRALGIRAPVIMVSAEASEGNVPEEIRALHNGYIIKPFKQKRLLMLSQEFCLWTIFIRVVRLI